MRFALTVFLCCMITAAQAFDLQGHRGARGLAPENTLAAFAKALEIGVTTLEMDTAITSDGVVMVSHNARLNPDITRGPDGRWLQNPTPAINELTERELQRYDVGRIRPGSDYSHQFPVQRRLDRERIPTLSSVFNLARRSGVRFNIETKVSPLQPEDTPAPQEFARILVELVLAERMAERVTIQSFDWRTLATVRKLAPQIETSYLSAQLPSIDNIQTGRESPWTAGIQVRDHGSVAKMVKAAGGQVWSPYHGDLTQEQVREAKALGLKVLPWTVNDPAVMDRLIGWGVDGIISDYPDRLREAAAARKLPLPAQHPAR